MISGRMEGRVLSGTTGDGEEACSFSVASGDGGQRVTRVRVNAYGSVAAQCEQDGRDGSYCVITGELMNRPGKYGKLTEIRAKKVEFFYDVDNDELGASDARQEGPRKIS
jgi:hypothetical protein